MQRNASQRSGHVPLRYPATPKQGFSAALWHLTSDFCLPSTNFFPPISDLMKNRIKHFVATFFCIAVLVLLIDIKPTEAQFRDDPDWGRQGSPSQPMGNPSGPPQLPGAPQQTPIGSGLALLLAAGGAYAVKKLKQNPA